MTPQTSNHWIVQDKPESPAGLQRTGITNRGQKVSVVRVLQCLFQVSGRDRALHYMEKGP